VSREGCWCAAGTLVVVAAAWVAGRAEPRPEAAAPRLGYTIVSTYPHDAQAFTQGLEYHDGFLYEGTGLNGRSSIRQVELETGKVVRRQPISPAFFGEGITIWGHDLIQLTWKSQIAFVYDVDTFVRRRTFTYAGEGWGLTHDATSLIMSDGTPELRFIDPSTDRERRRVTVTDNGSPVRNLNELEYVQGQVLANVWQTDRIARIDPTSGRVTAWIDLTGLLGPAEPPHDVLNGIAYDAAGDRLFVTGKLWPKLFEIKIASPAGRTARH
jgi:glutamine cyclotransferase